MGRRVLGLDVVYARDGELPGSLFVDRPQGHILELTTPLYIIRIEKKSAFDLWIEMARLFGWTSQ